MRHNSNVTTRQVVRYVRHRLGDAGVAALLDAAGERRPPEVLEDLTEWSSYEEGKRLFEAAGRLLGGARELREVGRHVDRSDGNPEMLALFQSLGSPSELLRFIAETAAKFCTVVAMEAVEIGENHGVVAARSTPGFPRYPELCEFTAGMLAQSPDIFGCAHATVEETECETRGDARCLFVLAWDPAGEGPSARVKHLEETVQALSLRLEALSSTVGDLLSGDDVDCVLERIVSRAALAIRAPRYLLAVRMDEGAPARVQRAGFDDDASDLVGRLLDPDDSPASSSCLVVDVRSARRHYGRLAAVNPDGVSFLPDERTVLGAYAKLSAAALDSAAALEASRSQAALTRTLLDLANHLANASGRRETAERLATAVPEVIGCDVASVLTFDRARRVMTFAGFSGFSPEQTAMLDGLEVHEADTPWFAEIVASPRPLFFDRSTDDDYIRMMLDFTGISGALIVPIVAAGSMFGVVNAGVPTGRLVPESGLLDRLAGLADQAATAFRNAELVDVIREQAVQDALTGTANRRLLEDRVDGAVAGGAGAAVLFVDLDGFKLINDERGHDAGDDLLRAVAERLTASVRGTDTVARLGGDEFAVLLPGVVDVDAVAGIVAKIERALAVPFRLDGAELSIIASVGAAVSPHDGDDCRTLLMRADARMYEAKRSRRAVATAR